MVETIADNSIREGRAWSRLPEMSEDWRVYITGTADFFSLNYYTSRLVDRSVNISAYPNPSWLYDTNLSYSTKFEWIHGKSIWLYSVPEGLRGILKYVFGRKIDFDNLNYSVPVGLKKSTTIRNYILRRTVGQMMVKWTMLAELIIFEHIWAQYWRLSMKMDAMFAVIPHGVLLITSNG